MHQVVSTVNTDSISLHNFRVAGQQDDCPGKGWLFVQAVFNYQSWAGNSEVAHWAGFSEYAELIYYLRRDNQNLRLSKSRTPRHWEV